MEPQEGSRPDEGHSDDFRMYEYKVKQCRKSRPHDWTLCPAAHNGEKAKRRDPRRFAYTGAACPDYRKNGTCRRGDACPFAHGVFESWLHPSRYRTQCCTDGLACRRRVCFFAHQESELRKPEEDSALLAAQLQAEAIASTDSYQQILAEAAIEAGEVPPGAQGTPQLNLADAVGSERDSDQLPVMQLLQALLRGNGGMDRGALSVQEPDDSAERMRTLQLQALLTTLQMRVSQAQPQRPPPPPQPQPQPQPRPRPRNSLGALDTSALARLLAANQALAERDIVQRNSLDAARRNSFSADAEAQRADLRFPFQGGFPGGLDSAAAQQWSHETADASRRMSVDNAPGGNGLPLHLQGLDPRILAALSSQRPNAAQVALAQAQNEAAEQALRRSVDMGSLAHNTNSHHGANTANKQGDLQAGMARPNSAQQGLADIAALSNAFARGSLMEGQASGQLPPAGGHSKRSSRDYGHHYDGFSSQASSQLQAQLSSQLGSLGPASLGSLPLSSLGSMIGQPASRMSSYGQQYNSSQDSSRRMSLESLSHFNPGAPLGSSLGSRNRGLTEQQAQLLLQLQAEEEQDRRGEALYNLSGGSTPSNAPPTPGRPNYPTMPSPRMSYNSEPGLQGMANQAPLGAGLKSSRSTPAIPEEGPAPSIRDFPRSSLDAARMMPTLLEQLQAPCWQQMYDAQRRSSPSQDPHDPRFMQRNSSFESLSADLPRSISDLNLAEHAASMQQGQP